MVMFWRRYCGGWWRCLSNSGLGGVFLWRCCSGVFMVVLLRRCFGKWCVLFLVVNESEPFVRRFREKAHHEFYKFCRSKDSKLASYHIHKLAPINGFAWQLVATVQVSKETRTALGAVKASASAASSRRRSCT